MGMSTSFKGFRPPDEKWKKMKAIWDSCEAAGIPVPEKVAEFFGWIKPDPRGIEVDLRVSNWTDESSEGYELKVEDIPENVTVIRFYNSW